MKTRKHYTPPRAIVASLAMLASAALAQQAPTPPPQRPAPATAATVKPAVGPGEEEVVTLTPFEVSADAANSGYGAATTLAGNRLNTELRDVGNAVSVITPQFLKDINATSNESLLQYTTGTEVGSIQGNFAGLGDGAQLNEGSFFKNPNMNTRVRGLAAADNSRDYFLTDIPWDGFNTDRIDLQRGPNSIMFGQGSPAGLINASTQSAAMRDSGEVDVRYSSHDSKRASLNVNRVLLKNELAMRLSVLHDHEKFQQEPSFEKDRRLYGALRYEPQFLKRGSARTVLKVNYEKGDLDSNRPRTLPPYDQITPWFLTGTYQGKRPGDANNDGVIAPGEMSPYTFQRLNKLTVNAYQAQQDNLARPNHGQNRPGINGGPFTGALNPSYRPELGAMAQSLGGAPWAFFAGPGQAVNWWNEEPRETYGLNAAGAVVGGVGFNFHRPVTVGTPSQWAKAAGVDYAEIYKNSSLVDSSIFDFYNQLMDGETKKEWQNWNTYNISLAQTFFRDKLGFEFNYNKEKYRNGQIQLFTDTRQAIRIDMMTVHADGTQAGTGTAPNNLPFGDGTANANLGRPYITDNGQFGNNSLESERTGVRATAFFSHDFRNARAENMLTRILGRHTFTGLVSTDERKTDERTWMRYSILDKTWREFQGYTEPSLKFDNGDFTPSAIIYLGPSLLNASSASGADLSRVRQQIDMGGSYTVRAFNSRWANRPGVNPGDPWINPVFLPPSVEYANVPGYQANPNAVGSNGQPLYPDRRVTTQSRNPLNYIGWQNVPVTITDSEDSQDNRDLLTTRAALGRNKLESKALVWQGKLLDNAIVGTYGWRQDTSERWSYEQTSSNRNAPGHLDLSPSMYRLPTNIADGKVVNPRSGNNGTDAYGQLPTVTSKAYSIAAHLNDLPGLSRVMERWPINVSLLYAHSSNFQPLANRSDLYGNPIAPPEGTTREKGILLETKDGKYSFKVNKYETSVANSSSGGLSQQWFISASQQWGGNWANHFQYNWTGDNIDSAVSPDHPEYTTSSQWNYGTAAGETAAQALARENAAVSAWRAWQNSAVAKKMYAAWQIDLQRPFTPGRGGLPATAPAGFTLTEDTKSEGYEFELTATPVRNWRLAFNASKTEATRKNVGGAALAEFISAYETALKTTAAGDMRVWWGGAGNETTLFQWNQNIGFEWTSRKLQEGTQAPEIRKWRFNAITNYDFTQGRLKGLGVGGGIRYQDPVIIGYTPTGGSSNFSIDLNKPYQGPGETNIDLWMAYERKLSDKLGWRIQVNVRNIGQREGLIPVTVQPDGTPAAYRIAPSQTWTVSNTFKF